MKKEDEKYAAVTWCWEDIKTLRPHWSKAKCVEFLQANESHIQDRVCELGWEVIEALM